MCSFQLLLTEILNDVNSENLSKVWFMEASGPGQILVSW